MPHHETRGKTVRCRTCGGDCLEFASFCIACGEPLGTDGDESEDRHHLFAGSAERIATPTHTLSTLGLLRLESALGLLILALAVGYALYTWRAGTLQSEAYRDGVAAVMSRDWDRAMRSFNEASGYLDAPRRKDQAREQVLERDRLYYAGVLAERHEQWKAAISSFEQVLSIQPAFLDSERRLVESRAQGIRDGLADVAYLVADSGAGALSGLYVRDSRGRATLLPGSDRRSAIRAISNNGTAFVYDRPRLDAGYTTAPQSHEPDVPGRVLVLAQRTSGELVTTTLLPQLDPEGTGTFSAEGLWWSTSSPNTTSFSYEVSYVRGYDGANVTRVSDLQSGKRVVAFDPPGSRLVIAEDQETRGSYRRSNVYVADATGEHARLLISVEGEVQRASVSQDGRWLLFQAQQNEANIERSVWVVDLVKAYNAVKLDSIAWSGFRANTRLSASFVPSSSGTYSVIVSRTEGDTEGLTLYDLQNDTRVRVWNGPSDGAVRRDLSALSADGRYLSLRQHTGGKSSLGLAGIQPGSPTWSSAPLPAYGSQIVRVQLAPGGMGGRPSHLVASVRNPEGISRGDTQSIFSAPLATGGILSGIKQIATANLPYDAATPASTISANGLILAYVSPARELRAVFLDGSGDTLIAPNVRAVWNLLPARDVSWWR